MRTKYSKKEHLENVDAMLTLYLFAVEEVRRLKSPDTIKQFLQHLRLHSGLCRAFDEHTGIWPLQSGWMGRYLRPNCLFAARTPMYHGYVKEKTLVALNKRVDILRRELSRITQKQ